jgi:pimeloyl-ACP methyl ester carboxylesterase
LLAEGARFAWEYGAMQLARPMHRYLPAADGHDVLIIPGFLAGDWSTVALRRHLDRLGYRTHGWDAGPNLGARDYIVDAMVGRFDDIIANSDGKISIIGHSLGGLFARELARMRPDDVRQVITMGSPIRDRGKSNHVWRAYELVSGHASNTPLFGGPRKRRLPPGPPSTAIYTKSDGLVSWRVCVENDHPSTQNIEVYGSHCGLSSNPMVFAIIADRLSRPDGAWRRFKWRKLDYSLFRHS